MSSRPMWAITATVESERDGWHSTRQTPTFYLDPNVSGIVDEAHAVRIATSIIHVTGDDNNVVHVCAVLVDA